MTTCFHSCTKCNAKFMFKKQLEQHINREHVVSTPSLHLRGGTSNFINSVLGTTNYQYIIVGTVSDDALQRPQAECNNQASANTTYSWITNSW